MATTSTSTSTSTSKRPTHYLYAVTKREDAKASWVRIGAAWPNGDGKGFSLRLDLIPVNGADIVMREPKDEGDAS